MPLLCSSSSPYTSCLVGGTAALSIRARAKCDAARGAVAALERECADLTTAAGKAKRRSEAADRALGAAASETAASLASALAVNADLAKLLEAAEARERDAAGALDELKGAAAGLRERLESAKRERDDVDVSEIGELRRRYCRNADLQVVLAREKTRAHLALSESVRANRADDGDGAGDAVRRARRDLVDALHDKRDRLLRAAAAHSDSDSTRPGSLSRASWTPGRGADDDASSTPPSSATSSALL